MIRRTQETSMFYRIEGNQDCIQRAQPARRSLWARFIYWLAGDIDTTGEYYGNLDTWDGRRNE